jgi:hypothetical protein
LILWGLGTITNQTWISVVGLPTFIGGAQFVALSKTLIYQDNENASLKEMLKTIEKKIDESKK